jgi:uncharacterized membrane protein
MICLRDCVNVVSFALNIVGVLIILFGAAVSLADFIRKGIFKRNDLIKLNESIRIRLGSYLVFGLEFFIAGDIIKTIYV